MLNVEVVYASQAKQILLSLQVTTGTTVLKAIEQSGILQHVAELGSDVLLLRDRVGIYGQSVPLDTILQNEDRVEIYRPLVIDPKIARREKAKPFLKQKKIQEKLEKRANYVKKKSNRSYLKND